jgi:hypothetical protein
MKIARSVRLLRFGGVLALGCVVGGVDVVRNDGFTGGAEAGAAGFGTRIVIDGLECPKKEAADIGEGAGAAWRDASLGAESEENAERMVDALGVLEAIGFLGQDSQEVGVVVVEGGRVVGAEAGG